MDGILIMKILYGISIALVFGTLIYFARVIIVTSTMEDRNKKPCKNSH